MQVLWTLLAALVATQIAVFATTVYLHRAAAHRALILHPSVVWGFRFSLWLTTGINVREWVAVHRKHHAHTDEEGDPHSPKVHGFWKVQLGNVFLYLKEARNTATQEKYAPDFAPDAWERYLFRFTNTGLAIGIAILCLTLGLWWGLLAAAIHTFLYVFVLSPSINGLCHHVGYKNYPAESATNLRWLALLTGGEGLHNNHHGAPGLAKYSRRRWEIDPAWALIRALEAFGLARDVRSKERSATTS